MRVCLLADLLPSLESIGQFWTYLNWALGLRANGCEVIWLVGIMAERAERYRNPIRRLQQFLEPYGFEGCLAIYSKDVGAPPRDITHQCLTVDDAAEAHSLLNFHYDARSELVRRFPRSALIDLDPGLLQIWIRAGGIALAEHTAYFSIGERVTGGPEWQQTRPCVALEAWPPCRAAPDSPFTTISNWWANEWVETPDAVYENNKRAGFLPYLDLPGRTRERLELALCLAPTDDDERLALTEKGWSVSSADETTATPSTYQSYIQASRGEFSCAKPSCVCLQNAWVSDRTVCYLASGKPVIVQHTGPSDVLPDAGGMFRFRNFDEAVRCLEMAAADYDHQCTMARALACELFDAKAVVGDVLEKMI